MGTLFLVGAILGGTLLVLRLLLGLIGLVDDAFELTVGASGQGAPGRGRRALRGHEIR
jgi:hypothetical protein